MDLWCFLSNNVRKCNTRQNTLNLVSHVDYIEQQDIDEHETNKLVNTYKDIFQGLGKIKANGKIYIEKTVQAVIDSPWCNGK